MESDLKLYFSIKEVSEIFDIPFSSLRFYEKQFPQLNPKRNSKGIRQYTKKDIELIKEIIELVKKEGHTLLGAKLKLKQNLKHSNDKDIVAQLKKIKSSLQELLKTIN